MENRNLSKIIMDTGIIIAVGTALLYIGGYNFELGRFAYYKLPIELIDISTSSILAFAYNNSPTMPLLFAILYLNVLFIYPYLGNNSWRSLMVTISVFFILLFSSLIASEYCNIKFEYIIILTSVLFTGATDLLIYKKHKKRYFESVPAIPDEDYYSINLGVLFKFTTIVLAVICFFMFCLGTGWQTAKYKEKYLVTGQHSNVVILSKNTDYLVGKTFDLKTKRLTDSILFIKLNEKETTVLIQKEFQLKDN